MRWHSPDIARTRRETCWTQRARETAVRSVQGFTVLVPSSFTERRAVLVRDVSNAFAGARMSLNARERRRAATRNSVRGASRLEAKWSASCSAGLSDWYSLNEGCRGRVLHGAAILKTTQNPRRVSSSCCCSFLLNGTPKWYRQQQYAQKS